MPYQIFSICNTLNSTSFPPTTACISSLVYSFSPLQLDETQEKRQEKLKNQQREILQKINEEQPLVCSFMHAHTLNCSLALFILALVFVSFPPSCWLYFSLQQRLRLERDCDAELERLPEEICRYLQGELESKGLRSDALFSQLPNHDSAGSGPPSNCSTPPFNSPNHTSSLDDNSSSSTVTSESELTAI